MADRTAGRRRRHPLPDGDRRLHAGRSRPPPGVAPARLRRSEPEASPDHANGVEAQPRMGDSGGSADRAAGGARREACGVRRETMMSCFIECAVGQESRPDPARGEQRDRLPVEGDECFQMLDWN